MARQPRYKREQQKEAILNGTYTKPPSHRRKWSTEESLQQDFIRYLEFCHNQTPKPRIPSIQGFSVFVDTTDDVVNDYDNIYPLTYKKIRLALYDDHLNCHDTIRSIFMMKALHGLRDQDTASSAITVNYNAASDAQLESWMKQAGLISAPSVSITDDND